MIQKEPYGVLKCNIIETTKVRGETPHFHIHAIADKVHYRIAINIKSQVYPYEVLYFINHNFHNKILKKLIDFPLGFSELGPNIKEEYGLDYIKGNLFPLENLTPLPYELPGPNNDLDEKIRDITHKALQNPENILYVFGKQWEIINKKDSFFDFYPSIGVHDVHMNQDFTELSYKTKDSWNDGGLLVHYVSDNKWSAVFFAFQSQFTNAIQ